MDEGSRGDDHRGGDRELQEHEHGRAIARRMPPAHVIPPDAQLSPDGPVLKVRARRHPHPRLGPRTIATLAQCDAAYLAGRWEDVIRLLAQLGQRWR